MATFKVVKVVAYVVHYVEEGKKEVTPPLDNWQLGKVLQELPPSTARCETSTDRTTPSTTPPSLS